MHYIECKGAESVGSRSCRGAYAADATTQNGGKSEVPNCSLPRTAEAEKSCSAAEKTSHCGGTMPCSGIALVLISTGYSR